MNDTHPDIDRYLIQRFLALPARERILLGFGLIEMGWKMAEIAVKKRNPQLTGRGLQLAVFCWMYRDELPASTLNAITLETGVDPSLFPSLQQL